MSAPTSQELLVMLNRRLGALRKSRPDLESALALSEQLIRLPLESARPPHAQPFALPRERLVAQIQHGVPMLHDQPAEIDLHYAADLFSRLVNALQQREDPELKPRLQALIAAATGGQIDPHQLFTEAFVQHPDHVAELAHPTGVDSEVLATLAAHAVAPLLRVYAEHLLPLLDPLEADDTAHWQHGYCPVCGSWPLLGELRGIELAEFLRCSACGSGWRWRRMSCAYCGNDDYQTLGTLHVDGEQRFRVSVCERCKGYLKVGNAFDPPPPALLALDDVASMHLDVAAIERGYQRPTGSGYRIELAVPEEEWVEELA